MGAAHKYSKEDFALIFDKIIKEISNGLSITKSLIKHGIDSTTFYRYTTEDCKNKMKEAKINYRLSKIEVEYEEVKPEKD